VRSEVWLSKDIVWAWKGFSFLGAESDVIVMITTWRLLALGGFWFRSTTELGSVI
jgi:hypothetical protein